MAEMGIPNADKDRDGERFVIKEPEKCSYKMFSLYDLWMESRSIHMVIAAAAFYNVLDERWWYVLLLSTVWFGLLVYVLFYYGFESVYDCYGFVCIRFVLF